eukprot:1777408-Pleurochrysis_carterae.AAC.2
MGLSCTLRRLVFRKSQQRVQPNACQHVFLQTSLSFSSAANIFSSKSTPLGSSAICLHSLPWAAWSRTDVQHVQENMHEIKFKYKHYLLKRLSFNTARSAKLCSLQAV